MFNILAAVVLDIIFGDPGWLPHPVRVMGKIISVQEKIARRLTNTRTGLKIAGFAIVATNAAMGVFVPIAIMDLLNSHSLLQRAVEITLIYTCIAARSLSKEALGVSQALAKGLEAGREKLSYIVGRDTDTLTEEGVVRATVETVAENTSDGVIAPLLYIMVFGLPGGIIYKFVNTMDSMIGYDNEKYRDLGYFAAKTDDLLNLIPARLTAALMIISTLSLKDMKRTFRIVSRDGRNHKSPNSGYPESAVAGILSIQLGGSSSYKGVLVHKPTIGDVIMEIRDDNINDTIKIMYKSEFILLLIFILVKLASL